MSKRAEAEALSAKLSHRHKELRKCLYDVKSDKDAIREEMSALELLRDDVLRIIAELKKVDSAVDPNTLAPIFENMDAARQRLSKDAEDALLNKLIADKSVIQEAYDFTSVSKAPPSPAPAPQQVASTETKIPAAVSPAPTKSQLPSIGGSASKGSTGRATDRRDDQPADQGATDNGASPSPQSGIPSLTGSALPPPPTSVLTPLQRRRTTQQSAGGADSDLCNIASGIRTETTTVTEDTSDVSCTASSAQKAPAAPAAPASTGSRLPAAPAPTPAAAAAPAPPTAPPPPTRAEPTPDAAVPATAGPTGGSARGSRDSSMRGSGSSSSGAGGSGSIFASATGEETIRSVPLVRLASASRDTVTGGSSSPAVPEKPTKTVAEKPTLSKLQQLRERNAMDEGIVKGAGVSNADVRSASGASGAAVTVKPGSVAAAAAAAAGAAATAAGSKEGGGVSSGAVAAAVQRVSSGGGAPPSAEAPQRRSNPPSRLPSAPGVAPKPATTDTTQLPTFKTVATDTINNTTPLPAAAATAAATAAKETVVSSGTSAAAAAGTAVVGRIASLGLLPRREGSSSGGASSGGGAGGVEAALCNLASPVPAGKDSNGASAFLDVGAAAAAVAADKPSSIPQPPAPAPKATASTIAITKASVVPPAGIKPLDTNSAASSTAAAAATATGKAGSGSAAAAAAAADLDSPPTGFNAAAAWRQREAATGGAAATAAAAPGSGTQAQVSRTNSRTSDVAAPAAAPKPPPAEPMSAPPAPRRPSVSYTDAAAAVAAAGVEPTLPPQPLLQKRLSLGAASVSSDNSHTSQVSATDTERVARPASTRAAAAAAIAAAAREEKLPRRTADPAAQGPVVAERSKMAAVTEAAAAAAAAAAMGTAAVGTDGRPVSAQTALHGADAVLVHGSVEGEEVTLGAYLTAPNQPNSNGSATNSRSGSSRTRPACTVDLGCVGSVTDIAIPVNHPHEQQSVQSLPAPPPPDECDTPTLVDKERVIMPNRRVMQPVANNTTQPATALPVLGALPLHGATPLKGHHLGLQLAAAAAAKAAENEAVAAAAAAARAAARKVSLPAAALAAGPAALMQAGVVALPTRHHQVIKDNGSDCDAPTGARHPAGRPPLPTLIQSEGSLVRCCSSDDDLTMNDTQKETDRNRRKNRGKKGGSRRRGGPLGAVFKVVGVVTTAATVALAAGVAVFAAAAMNTGLDEVEEVTGHHKGSTSTGKARVAGGSGGRMAGGRPPSDTDAFDTLRVDRKQGGKALSTALAASRG